MFNRMTKEKLEDVKPGRKGSSRSQVADIPDAELAEKLIHMRDGVPGITFEMIYACLVSSGRFVKYEGLRKVSNRDESLLSSFLTIEGDFFPFPEDCREWVVDKRCIRTEKGTAQLLIRPKFPKWGFELHIEVDNDEVPNALVRQLFNRAGKYAGLGSFAKRGPFGRFEVIEWKETPLFE